MKIFTLVSAFVFTASLSLSAYSAQAQAAIDSGNSASVIPSGVVAAAGNQPASGVGKEIPVPGSVLFVTPAERAAMEKEMASKEEISAREKRRNKRLKRQDRREVTQVIGHSVNTYLANVYDVHTLQRF